MNLNILFEDNHILVVEKPVNIPVQADDSKDMDLLTMLKDYIKEKYQKPGNVYLGLVHRLDRPVGGVMVFAKTSKAAARLSKQVQMRTIEKYYLTITTHVPAQPSGKWEDYLVKDHATNRVRVVKADYPEAKKAILRYECIDHKDELALLRIHLETGRSHQIRVQTSSRSLAIWGDQRYNKQAHVGQQIALYAYRLELEHPTTKEHLVFTSYPKGKPWDLFTKNFPLEEK